MISAIGRLFPAGPDIPQEALVASLEALSPLGYFDEEAMTFLAALSRRLMNDAESRQFPELVSLGFFLRRGAIEQLEAEFVDTSSVRRFPIGTVAHFPPANVDTMFVYSWALSLLCGNANVVRLSSRAGAAARIILRVLGDTVAHGDFPRITASQLVISYERADEITAAISRVCDLRVIWGGDETVESIRQFSLRPAARDITFPDRHSFAVISAQAYERLDDRDRRHVAQQFFNDVFWFDQAGCSSPRWLVWQGDAEQSLYDVRRSFARHLDEVIQSKHFQVETGMAIEKMAHTYGAAMVGGVERIETLSNELTLLWAPEPESLPRVYSGAGVLFETQVSQLEELAGLIERRDQTIVHFGFSNEQLHDFATACGGRGVDRMVPFGQALAFSTVWDGLDLLAQMTRLVDVRPSD